MSMQTSNLVDTLRYNAKSATSEIVKAVIDYCTNEIPQRDLAQLNSNKSSSPDRLIFYQQLHKGSKRVATQLQDVQGHSSSFTD